ncbi:MAG TPA: hypothetical protein VIU86_19885 [Gaiellaceae bacterium]
MSSIYAHFRVTPEELDEIKGTAEYLGLPYGEYLRLAHAEKRAGLVAQGLRPPKKPRDSGT